MKLLINLNSLVSNVVFEDMIFANSRKYQGASLVAQWLRICLTMQGTRVRALVWEDPTCRGTTRPVSHNYWACVSGACAPQQEAASVRGPHTAMKSGPRSPQLEKALAQKPRPNTAKNKLKKKKSKYILKKKKKKIQGMLSLLTGENRCYVCVCVCVCVCHC